MSLVLFDKVTSLSSECIRCVVKFRGRLSAAQDSFGLKVVVSSAEETKELVEATLLRMLVRLVSEMPFANKACCIVGTPETIGQSLLRDRHSTSGPTEIGFMPEAVLVSTCQKPRSGWRTIRASDVAIRKSHARCRKGIEVRCRDVFAAVKTDIGVSHVITDDDQDVGLLCANKYRRGTKPQADSEKAMSSQETRHTVLRFWLMTSETISMKFSENVPTVLPAMG